MSAPWQFAFLAGAIAAWLLPIAVRAVWRHVRAENAKLTRLVAAEELTAGDES